MLFILSGPSAVGKSYCVEYFCAALDCKTLTPYTTRPPRVSESEGFHYHFRSLPELRDLSANFSVGYWAKPLNDGHVYGYTPAVDALSDDPGSWVIQIYSDIAIRIRDKSPRAILVFLDYGDDDTLRHRIEQRYSDEGPEAVERRLAHAAHERSNKGRFDHIVTSNSPEQIARELLKLVLEHSSAVPQHPPSAAGALADVDIRASLEAPDGLRIEGVPTEQLLGRINGWSVDLTLAPRYYRVAPQRLLRRVLDLAHGDSTDMLRRFREDVVSPNEGIYLRPHEFILASTAERLRVPSRMAALISGRSSYARMGISIELSQVIVQPGHDDVVPLQVRNNMPQPIIVYPGVPIAQAAFFYTISPSAVPYSASARAKYPPHANDIRSRYYLDPAYERIRAAQPPKRIVDWDHLLNVLLFVLVWLTAASLFVGQLPDQGFKQAGKYLAALFFGVTTLSGVVRLIRLMQRRQ